MVIVNAQRDAILAIKDYTLILEVSRLRTLKSIHIHFADRKCFITVQSHSQFQNFKDWKIMSRFCRYTVFSSWLVGLEVSCMFRILHTSLMPMCEAVLSFTSRGKVNTNGL